MASGVTAIAYETVTSARGGLPLLAPMSEVAGRMAIQAGAHCLEMEQGGRGMLLGGVAGVAPAKVVVLGGGVSGVNAARMGDRARGAGHRARHQRRPPLRHRPAVRRRRQHHLLHAPGGRGLRARGRPRDRRGAGAGSRGAEADHREARARHEARLGAGRHLHRPGRLLGDLAAHHPRQPDLRACTTSCTTASPTCRAPWRAPPPSRSTTPRCPSSWRWPTRAPRPPCWPTRTCSTASTSTRGASRTQPSPPRSASTLADPRKLLAG